MCALLEGFPSGQRDQTVNLTRELRWFESTPLHHESKAASGLQPGLDAGRDENILGQLRPQDVFHSVKKVTTEPGEQGFGLW